MIDIEVRDIIERELGVDRETLTDAATFEDLGCDSLDRVEIVMALEEHFSLEIPDDDAERLTTVKQVIDYVLRKTGKP